MPRFVHAVAGPWDSVVYTDDAGNRFIARYFLIQPLVRPMAIVIFFILLKHSLKLASVEKQEMIRAFSL